VLALEIVMAAMVFAKEKSVDLMLTVSLTVTVNVNVTQ
jgi:hypothetical protein